MPTDTFRPGAVVTFDHPRCPGHLHNGRYSNRYCRYLCEERAGERATIMSTNHGALLLRFADGTEFWADPEEVGRV